jgi:hypothetical protein
MLPKPRNHWALIALLVDILRLYEDEPLPIKAMVLLLAIPTDELRCRPDETAALAYKFYNIFKTNTLTGPALAFDDYVCLSGSLSPLIRSEHKITSRFPKR